MLRARGLNKSESQAVYWWQKASIQGHRVAQAHLGIRFATGLGVTKNTVTAVKWWRQSAEQGLHAGSI